MKFTIHTTSKNVCFITSLKVPSDDGERRWPQQIGQRVKIPDIELIMKRSA